MTHGFLYNLDLTVFLLFVEIIGDKDLGLFTLYETECLVFCLVLPFAIFFYKTIPYKPWDTARKVAFYIIALTMVFVTMYINPIAALSLPIVYILYFVFDFFYDKVKQLWAKWLHIEIEANALEDDHVEGQTAGIDSVEIYESVRNLKDTLDRPFKDQEGGRFQAKDEFRRIVEKIRHIIRYQRNEKTKLRDKLVYNYMNVAESFEDSESEQIDDLRMNSEKIEGSEDLDSPSFNRQPSQVNFKLKQNSGLSNASGLPIESEMFPMTSSRIVPFNTQNANLMMLAKSTQDFEKDGIGDDEDKQSNQAAYNPLEWPKGIKNQIFYVLFFPVNFVFFFLFPNIVDTVSHGKVALMMTILVACLVGLIMLLLSIEFTILRHLKLKYHLVGMFNALIFVFP